MSISPSPLTPSIHPFLEDSSVAHSLQLTFFSLFPLTPLHASPPCAPTPLLFILAHATSPSPLTPFHPSLPSASSISSIPPSALKLCQSLNHPPTYLPLPCRFIHHSTISAHIHLLIFLSISSLCIHPCDPSQHTLVSQSPLKFLHPHLPGTFIHHSILPPHIQLYIS